MTETKAQHAEKSWIINVLYNTTLNNKLSLNFTIPVNPQIKCRTPTAGLYEHWRSHKLVKLPGI